MQRNIVRLALKLKKELQEDILNRYDNSEYWETQVADDFYKDNKVNDDEAQKIIEILEL
jgi:hypothetical protein